MNLIHLRWRPEALGHATDAVILAPEPSRVPPPWNTLYLLHGRGDDCTSWTRNASVERQANDYPLLIVMPSGQNSYYRDPIGGEGVATAITRDLIATIEATFPVRATRAGRALAGNSMGGYGALHLAASHPHLFGVVSAHSPAVLESRRVDAVDRANHLELLFGDPIVEETTLLGTLARLDPAIAPAIRIDCGDRDFLLEECRVLHAHLTDVGLPHTYVERPGGHDWNYWDRMFVETLRFIAPRMAKG